METLIQPSNQSILPHRIVAARERGNLSQADLSKRVGFKDRQTLAAIEAWQRRVTPEELVAIAEATGQDVDFFTDPFRLVGEGEFSYRASGTPGKALDKFEEQAGRWLALWRQLGEFRGEAPNLLRPRLAINAHSTFEQAQAAGEAVGHALGLGDVPAKDLAEALEKKFELLVLAVNMPSGVSGAAVQLASGDAIMINRAESSGRKAFDLAHELFHVLTWDALPPERVDRLNPAGYKQKRTEQLADNFAAALLMPRAKLKPRWERLRSANTLHEKLNSLAHHFGVSAAAVGWRLVALGWIKKGHVANPSAGGRATGDKSTLSPLFSRRFLERTSWGIDRGELSAQRMLELLGTNLEEYRASCKAFGVRTSIGL